VSPGRRDDRAGLLAGLRFSLCAAATAWVALMSWRGFTLEPSRFLSELVLVGVVVAVVGALLRWRRMPVAVVLAAQAVAGGGVVCQVVADRPYPGDAFLSALSRSSDLANTYAAPVPWTEGASVQPLLLVGGLVAMLAVDLCAASLRRVPLAGLPLLTVYSVPISLIDRGLSWWVFAGTATGFLFLLFLQEEEHLSRWGRSLDGSTVPVRRLSDSVRANAVGVGVIATVAAVLVPLAVPTFSFSVFDVGPGDGGDGDIEVTNPMIDLRQDLVRGDNVELVTVTTDDPSPDYLRISVLNRFTDEAWSAGDRKVPTSNLAQGDLPAIMGADESVVQFEEAAYDVSVSDQFRSRWLPTRAPITSITAEGDWRFDETTLDFLASDDELDTAGLDYEMTAALPTYREERLLRLDTNPSAVDSELTELPDDVPAIVDSLAREATDAATTDFERAVLLNQFFRETGGFTYDLPENPGDGVGTGDLAGFLDPDGSRSGYCEQFSAAMAVMARSLGIPARVAVGFLAPSDSDDNGSYTYRAHDLHAWVELFFPSAGWVLFDPTPSDGERADPVPGYADAAIADPTPTTGPTTVPEPEPTARPERPEPSAPTEAPEEQTPEAADEPAGSSFPWLVVVLVLAGLALLVALVLLPRLLRGRQRERRLAGGPESAWEELRATAVDLRLAWPEGRSPRETRDLVVGWFGRPGDDAQRPARGRDVAPDAGVALDRIADHVERLRYARHHVVPAGTLREEVLLCVAALEAGATPRVRRRARWLPLSAFQRRRVVEPSTDPGTGSGSGSGSGEPELVGTSEHL
jgi:transglutaminase-like putative cysteine protease